MKVYVLTSGNYSDYHIVGVTTDKKTADDYKAIFEAPKRDEWSITERINIEVYDTDCLYSDTSLVPFIVNFTASTGEIRNIINCFEDGTYSFYDFSADKVRYDRRWDRLSIHVKAKDEEHAKKIACDKLAEWKAKREGIT